MAHFSVAKYIRIHDMRHTHASILVSIGEKHTVIQERLGHSKLTTTLNLYVHPLQEKKRQTGNMFQKALESR